MFYTVRFTKAVNCWGLHSVGGRRISDYEALMQKY